MLALDAAKAVTARTDGAALDVNVDIVPVSKAVADALLRDRVATLEIAQGFIGEDHAPSEGVVRTTALNQSDAVRRVAQLRQNREIQPGGAAADANDPHRISALDGVFVHTCIIWRAARRR